jgi:beta-glucanase (GH16 family)
MTRRKSKNLLSRQYGRILVFVFVALLVSAFLFLMLREQSSPPNYKNDVLAASVDPTSGNPAPNGPTGDWHLAFSDEFNGTSLDTTKWLLCNPSFDSICVNKNHELQEFNQSLTNNANAKVSGGQLQLIATKQNGQIVSSMISTGPIPKKWGNYTQPGYQPFQFTYGYYEGKVKFPKGRGFWPSLWMLPDQEKYGDWPGSGEYDVIEVSGNDPYTGYFTAHWGGNGPCGHACNFQIKPIADVSSGWHTYGFDWEPTGLTWYVDGKQIGNTVTDPGSIQTHPFYIIANFSVGGTWGSLGPQPDNTTPYPSSMDIDYLRVWQKGAPVNIVSPELITPTVYCLAAACPTLPEEEEEEVILAPTVLAPTPANEVAPSEALPTVLPGEAPCVPESDAPSTDEKSVVNLLQAIIQLLQEFLHKISALCGDITGWNPYPEPSESPSPSVQIPC